jgi:hypothetical protein
MLNPNLAWNFQCRQHHTSKLLQWHLASALQASMHLTVFVWTCHTSNFEDRYAIESDPWFLSSFIHLSPHSHSPPDLQFTAQWNKHHIIMVTQTATTCNTYIAFILCNITRSLVYRPSCLLCTAWTVAQRKCLATASLQHMLKDTLHIKNF